MRLEARGERREEKLYRPVTGYLNPAARKRASLSFSFGYRLSLASTLWTLERLPSSL
jgi:hypothetical protein